jgi:dephospho-CoA kinase
VPVVDTDELARLLVVPGTAALAEIQARFGGAVIAPDGALRRDELARIVFADALARRQLEDILHPRIRDAWLAQVGVWRGESQPLAVVVIPLLFETGAESHFHKIICAACLAATQQARLAARHWTPEQQARRLAAQWPVDRKMALADYVLWTEGRPESLHRQIAILFAGLLP